MSETIWYKDLKSFMGPAHLKRLWFTKDDDLPTIMNVILRFAVYYAVLMTLLTSRLWPVTIALCVAIATYAIAEQSEKPPSDSRRPTADNPWMNHLPYDSVDPPVENVLSNEVCHDIRAAYTAGIPADARDIFGRNTGERAFYTMPCTSAVNDADKFAKWLFRPNDDVTWKEHAVLYHK